MFENYNIEDYNFVEDYIIVLVLSVAITYFVYTVYDYYKPRLLIDLGNTTWLQ